MISMVYASFFSGNMGIMQREQQESSMCVNIIVPPMK
jgi:hypothetical protein